MTKPDPQPWPQQNEDARPCPREGRPVIVDVYAEPKTGSIDFSLKWRFADDHPDDTNPEPIIIPKKNKGDLGTMIQFHLHDRTGMGLAFDPVDPFWVSRTTCPQDWSEDSEIPADRIRPHNKLLTVCDLNEVACDLNFSLNFEDRDGNRLPPYDPQIKNGGTSE